MITSDLHSVWKDHPTSRSFIAVLKGQQRSILQVFAICSNNTQYQVNLLYLPLKVIYVEGRLKPGTEKSSRLILTPLPQFSRGEGQEDIRTAKLAEDPPAAKDP